ncbi:type IV pilus secretin PilQ [Candidatus Venteria ishoeyi]|uniref:type IV pilus secretin family protein n=1 Tax=Candidatus Venteria ishoeyi TaxID=1899563 RepID=UPI0025A4FB68|nr:type IV pilus secretin family protein [Candidatus Venteria ishoeyi]MDM8547841.1 type IV pilus secretin PilQ [Candidatus Venteria ishoeyi]
MNHKPMTFLLSVLSFLMLTTLLHAAPVQLNEINYSLLPGNQLEVSLKFNGNAVIPQHFPIDNPPMIVMDFPGVVLKAEKYKKIKVGMVNEINAVEAHQPQQRLRVVINLIRATPYEIFQSGERLIISLGQDVKATGVVHQQSTTPVASSQAESMQSAPALISPDTYAEPSIKHIDFHRSEDGGGRVIVKLSDPHAEVNMRREGRNVLIDFEETLLPERLDRKLDVKDFATPVMSIDSQQIGRKTRIAIASNGNFEHFGYQTNDLYTLEVKQKVEDPGEELTIDTKKYTGKRISFNFQEIEVSAVLNLLANMQGFNLVTTNDIKGKKIALRLKNVPWDQAWDIILESNALGYEELGNVRSVDLKSRLDERRREQLEASKQIKELEPLRTELIQINYSKAEDLKTLLQKRTTGSSDTGYSFLSSRGNISVDDRTNKLLVQDTADKISDIRRLILKLDRPVRQVLIESRVVIANDDFAKDLGVRFGQASNATFGSNDEWGITTGRYSTDGTAAAAAPGIGNFLVDLPAQPAEGIPAIFGLAVGKVGSYLLQLELSALQSEGRGQIVSSPRIITANQKKATVTQGVEVAVAGTPAPNAAAVPTFKEAVLELEVTPQITPDDRVIMDLKITKDNPEPGAVAGNFQRRSLETQVLVNNGETVVLGGVYEQTISNNSRRIPFLSNLPLIGVLFKNKKTGNSKKELLIFVTPKILQDASTSS